MPKLTQLVVALLVLPLLAFATAQGEKAAGVLPTTAGTYPIVKQPVTLSVWTSPESYIGDFNTNKATKFYEDLTGVHVNWTQVSQTDAAQKLSLLLSSGQNLPDVISSGALTNELVIVYASQGILIPLNSLIDKWGYGIKKVYKLNPLTPKVITAPDGKIYYLPYYNECYHCNYSQKAWINGTWLKKLGLKTPETTDDYYQVLKAFKEKDPNGNGKADEIPFISDQKGWHAGVSEFLMNPFTFNPGTFSDWRYIEGNKVLFAPTQPAWRDGLRYLRKLYVEGLMDPETFTITTDQIVQLTEGPGGNRVGSVLAGWQAFTNIAIEGAKNDFAALAPLKGPTGLRQTPVGYDGITPIFAITKDCKNPEIAFRWGDMQYDYPTIFPIMMGKEGEDWRKAKPGELTVTGQQATWAPITPYGQPHNSYWGQSHPMMATGETYYFSQAVDAGTWNLEAELYKASKFQMEPYGVVNKVLPPLFMDRDTVAALNEPLSNLRQYVPEQVALFVTGKKSLDTDWDAYLKEFDRLQLPKVLELTTKAYLQQYK